MKDRSKKLVFLIVSLAFTATQASASPAKPNAKTISQQASSPAKPVSALPKTVQAATSLPPKGNLWRELSEEQAKKRSLGIPSWAPLVESAQPAVVVISTEAVVEHPPLEVPGGGPFRLFMPVAPEQRQGLGSGFIFNPEKGLIITNKHVIEGAHSIKVTVGSEPRQYKATVIGSDEPLDIALLKIETEDDEKISWPFLPFGDSDKVKLGDPVMALGSPLGLVQSVNVGIVSHKHRGGIRPSNRDIFAELMQLQMPINPGNSGGPVLNDSGEVICVCQSISANGQGISFGVPIKTVMEIIPELLRNGQIERAFLGVEPTDLTPPYAKELGLSQNEKGAVLVQVMPNTPAEKAGLRPMDVILEVDGKKVSDSFNLRSQTAYKGIGNTVTLKVYRKNIGIKEFKVKLEKRPGQVAQVVKTEEQKLSSITIDSIGLEVADTSASVRSELSLSLKNPGSQVMGVAKRSSAEFASLAPGDVIMKVDGTAITSAKQLKDLIDSAPKEKTLMIIIRRGQAERFVSLEKR